MVVGAPSRPASVKEAVVQGEVEALARALGWLPVVHDAGGHIKRGGKRVRGDVPRGWPDLTLLHPKRPPVFVEVKRAGGRLRPEQAQTLSSLEAMGFTVVVVYGLEGLAELEAVLREVHVEGKPQKAKGRDKAKVQDRRLHGKGRRAHRGGPGAS